MVSSNIPASRERKSKSWLWLFFFGLVSLVIGISIGSTSVGSLCGNVFSGDHFSAELYDTMGTGGGAESTCIRKATAAAVPTWIFIVLGIILIITSLIFRQMPKREPVVISAPHAEKSLTETIAELTTLKAQGVITDAEFEAKRKDLLERM